MQSMFGERGRGCSQCLGGGGGRGCSQCWLPDFTLSVPPQGNMSEKFEIGTVRNRYFSTVNCFPFKV